MNCKGKNVLKNDYRFRIDVDGNGQLKFMIDMESTKLCKAGE
jgi:hypothetical protein